MISKLIVIESFVVALEYWLLKQVFKDMYRIGALPKEVSDRKTAATAIIANAVTSLLGITGWTFSAFFVDVSFR
jgi:hypothetical protein